MAAKYNEALKLQKKLLQAEKKNKIENQETIDDILNKYEEILKFKDVSYWYKKKTQKKNSKKKYKNILIIIQEENDRLKVKLKALKGTSK